MAATMGLGLLPMIKCSNCGIDVEISSMGDHVCAKSEPAPSRSKSDYDALPRNTPRTGPPAPINPSVANRPFLRPDNAVGVNEQAGLSPQPSPLRLVQQNQTAVPIQPQTSEIVTLNSDDLPRFPLPRSMSDKESRTMTPLPDQSSIPPMSSQPYTDGHNRPPATAPLPIDLDADAPPPPLPKDELSSLPRIAHKYGSSIDSKSSYRTSFASSRYGDSSSKRSTAMSGRRPSFGSVNQPYKYMDDDAPPVPSLYHTSYSVSDYNMSRESGNDRQDHGSFNLGGWHQTNLQIDNHDSHPGPLRVSSHTDSDRLSSNRGSAELFFQSPSQTSFERLPDPSEFPERSTSINPQAKVEYKPFKSPTVGTYLHPSTPDVDGHGQEDTQRRPSDATSEGALSVSNFARSLGLDLPEQAPENTTISSDSSPSDLRSGTSFSSVASEASTRRKPSEGARLGPVIEERRIDTHQHGLHAGDQTESPIELEPPHLRDPLFSPDSPTDPAILFGSVSLLPDKTHKALPEIPGKMRSATTPTHTQDKQSQDKNLPELPRAATTPLSPVHNKTSQDKNPSTVPALAPPMPAFEDEPSRGTRFFPDLEAPLPSPSHIPKKPSWTDRLSPERLRSKPSISHISKKQSREENIVPGFRRPSPEPGHVPQRPSRENVPDLRQPSPMPSPVPPSAKDSAQEKPYPNLPGFSVEQPFHISTKSRDETSTPPSGFRFPQKSSVDEKLPEMPRSSPEPSHVQNKPSREDKLAPVVPGFLPDAPFHLPRKPSWMDRFTPEVTRSPTPPISHTAKSSQDELSPPHRSKSPAQLLTHLQNKPSLDDKYLQEAPKPVVDPAHAPNKPSRDDKYLPELPRITPEPPSHIPSKPSQSSGSVPELTRSPPPPSHIPNKSSEDNKGLPEIPQPSPEPSHVPKPSQSDRLSPELARSPPPAHSVKLSQDDKSLPKPPEVSPLYTHWDDSTSPELPKSRTPDPSYMPEPIRDPRVSPEPPRSAPPPNHLHQPSRDDRPFPEPRSAEPRFAQEGPHIRTQSSRDEKNSPELLSASPIDPAARLSPRPKGPCRGCGEVILGKSVSSADGRLTGRYHKECFVCYQCRIPFRTADFYVLRDLPFCAQHYHERNGSLCQGCLTGIEGEFLETNERQGRGPSDRRRYHPQCLTCRTCNVLLNGEYFEWMGQVYCERDARRAAASTPPPHMRRPTMTSSPLAAHSRGPSRGRPPPPGYPGRGRGGPRPPMPPIPGMPGPAYMDGPYGPPPTARRFPERRTTKLMML